MTYERIIFEAEIEYKGDKVWKELWECGVTAKYYNNFIDATIISVNE